MSLYIPRIALLLCLGMSARSYAGTDEVCHVGAQLHLVSSGDAQASYMRHVRAFVEGGLADYALLVAQGLKDAEREEVVRYLAEHQVRFLVQEYFPTSAAWFATSGPPKPGELPHARYSRADYERMRAIAGDLFLGVHWGELDSSGLKPEDYLSASALRQPTRRQVKEAFVATVHNGIDLFHNHRATPFAHSSALLYHALFAEAGADILCSEIGENVPNFNLMLASNRGAARAYGRPWMIDHSTWWAPRGHAGEQVSPREGHTPWCLFTSLLEAAMGGADYVQLEVDWAAFDKQWQLLPWGQAMKTLFSLTRRIGPRGETVTPTAILIGHENGWPGVGWRIGDVRGTGLFDGLRHQFMQTRDADLSFKLLNVYYPGFERAGWDPEYPGFLAESPLGVCDVIPDNLSAAQLSRYRVLVALGYHRMTSALREQLRRYVEQGGVLVCGDTLFLDEEERPIQSTLAEQLVGATVEMRDRKLIHLFQPVGKLNAKDNAAPATSVEWQDHWLHPVRPGAARPVAWLNDAPLVLENAVGSGKIYFVTALNLVGSSRSRRGAEPFLYANALARFLQGLYRQTGDGIEFSPWTSLEHIYNERRDGSALLLVMNHGDMEYRRDAVLQNPRNFNRAQVIAQGNWTGWQAGEPVTFTEKGKVLRWSFTLAPKSFVLFEFK